jgi:Tfp pilus assembly protein PilF
MPRVEAWPVRVSLKSVAKACVVASAVAALSGCADLRLGDGDLAPSAKSASIAPGLLDATEQAIAAGRYPDAQKLLQQMFAIDAQNPRAKLLLAELHLATGVVPQAAAEFDQLKDVPEISGRALQGKGLAALLNGEKEAAAEALRMAVKQDANLWRAWNALGYYHDTKQQWPESAECYERALAANPNSALVYNNRGFSNLLQRRFGEAIADLSKAVEIDPALPSASRNLRLALASNGEYARALVGANGNNLGEALNNVGYIALLRGDYAAAESYLSRAMEADASFNRLAWQNLSYLKSINEMNKIRPK